MIMATRFMEPTMQNAGDLSELFNPAKYPSGK
jgi:hypothetical protein